MAPGKPALAERATKELVAELQRLVEGEVRFDPYSRALYSTDASIYQMEPVGVIIPRNEEDVVQVVRTAARYGVPVLPRGGGTSLSGQGVNHAIVLDFSKYMNRVLETNPEEGWVRVQPGITIGELNHHLQPLDLHYAPDPTTANRATAGGSVGNNSCGSHSVIYGKTIDHVRELDVVLSNGDQAHTAPLEGANLEARMSLDSLEGSILREVRRIARANRDEILRRFPKIMRRVSGYNLDAFVNEGPFDLTRLLVGSEGTLATIVEAKLSLVPLPHMKGLAVAHFHTMRQAMEATPAILEHSPSAVELLDRMILQRTRESVGFARRLTFVEDDPAALLLVEFYGDSEAELQRRLHSLKQDLERRHLAYATVVTVDPAQQANVWAVRGAGLGLLMSVKGDTKPLPFVEDTAVAPERLSDYIDRFDEIVRQHGTTAGYYGHASVGCMHIRPMINLKEQAGVEKMVSISQAVADLVLEFGGSLSGEHGDGIVRGVWNEKMFGPVIYNAFRELKRAFDPQNIMNPGKIVDCPPMTENLRIGPDYKALQLDTYLDFSRDGGFARSVELCNGMGACRKMVDGTMCPSYMATREEEHTTRGRANALRAVLSGLLPPQELTSKRLHDVLDLCIECKGCKAECPAQVDMAKLKYEVLTRYHQAHGLPLRARLFGNIAALSRLGSALAPVSNWGSRNPLTRWALDRFLGIDRRRPLPSFARPTFSTWFRQHQRHSATQPPARGPVVLFHDTFMDYNDPQVGQAVTRLLEAAGFQVMLVNKRCCGRPMVSKGMLPKARDNARYNVDLLYPYAKEGVPIVGCEPSCLLTLRDEYPDLLRDEKAQAVASQAFMIEEFLLKLVEEDALGVTFRETQRNVLFHGHCHQKALIGAEPALKALRLVPGHRVELVNSGCCGMAGSFGFEKEHYDVSYAIGAQRLFPAIQAPDKADWDIAISGVSCRQQIEHFTGRRPRHIVELLADALA